MFGSILHLPLDYKFYFNTKNHFLVSNYNNSYIYFNITIGLALRNCHYRIVTYIVVLFVSVRWVPEGGYPDGETSKGNNYLIGVTRVHKPGPTQRPRSPGSHQE